MATRAQIFADVERILEFKGLGWSDPQIKKHMGLDSKAYSARLKHLRTRKFFEEEAKTLCIETIHRMHDTRQKALKDYEDYKSKRQFNAAVASLKIVRDIDVEIPKTCLFFGWKPWEGMYDEPEGEQKDLTKKDDAELHDEYKRIIGSTL